MITKYILLLVILLNLFLYINCYNQFYITNKENSLNIKEDPDENIKNIGKEYMEDNENLSLYLLFLQNLNYKESKEYIQMDKINMREDDCFELDISILKIQACWTGKGAMFNVRLFNLKVIEGIDCPNLFEKECKIGPIKNLIGNTIWLKCNSQNKFEAWLRTEPLGVFTWVAKPYDTGWVTTDINCPPRE